jgi:Ni,Fe-hydrogenase III large subunit
MTLERMLRVHNGRSFGVGQCPVLSIDALRRTVTDEVAAGARIAALFARPMAADEVQLVAVLAYKADAELGVASAMVDGEYEALTPDCPQAHWFEREIAEQSSVTPSEHPWLKPIRFQPEFTVAATPDRPDACSTHACGDTEFFSMHGTEVHEVAVGPVHAGIIEPGHFRFQCHGETVYHLEISLGYQHRGIERALVCGPNNRTIHYMETLAGDTTIGHTTAHCRLCESLSKTRVPPRGQVIRGVAAELERIANHLGDLGALAGDVGFLPTMSYCGRIRGDALNLTAMLCGNRFGRNLVRPGGVCFDLEDRLIEEFLRRLGALESDARSAVELLWDTPSVMARFEGVGRVQHDDCERLGLVGPAARACGVEIDVRDDYPYGIYRFAHIPISTWSTGDVFARAYVRWLEVQRSLAFVREQVQSLPEGPVLQTAGELAAESMAVSLVEGWRGEICHAAITDAEGKFAFYKVVDPSFHNWFGLAWALRDQQISDFPLCNKSFNLSYCGHDL